MKRRRTPTLAVVSTLPICCYSWILLPYTSPSSKITALSSSPTSWHAALAIVPPDTAWDRIQAARYVARDLSYAVWPPAIRLFHPFVPTDEAAFDVAHIIENHHIAPFSVHLSEWSIVPHQEAMADLLDIPEAVLGDTDNEEREQFQALVRREEHLGRLRKVMRSHREQQKKFEKQQERMLHNEEEEDTNNSFQNADATAAKEETAENTKKSKKKKAKKKQQQQYHAMDEFNGPCVVCLEPDEESKQRLMELRALLTEELPAADTYAVYTTPSAASPIPIPRSKDRRRQHQRQDDADDNEAFRPVLPIASFSTVSEAIAVAQELRKHWEPVSFNVTDFHLITSCGVTDRVSGDDGDGKREKVTRSAVPLPPNRYTAQFGCDALISLVGAEIEMDDELNHDLAQMVAQNGIPGGYERANNEDDIAYDWTPVDNSSDDDDSNDKSVDLEQWLLQEDATYDEGTVVVMGRVQMFTGEAREYVGMPASKTLGKRLGKTIHRSSSSSTSFKLEDPTTANSREFW